MRTSEGLRAALAGAALLAAACDPAMMAGGSGRTSVTVAGRSVVIAGPAGFCVDRASSNTTSDGAFVLMTDCRLLGAGGGSGVPAMGAALTASVSTGGLAGEGDDPAQTLEEMREFAPTPEGRAMLGRSGQPGSVRILATHTRRDVFYVLVEDRGRQPIQGIDRRFWRAFLEVNGRMTALSVLGFEGAGLTPQEGLNHLAAFADAIQRANGAGPA
jgi:hypothetical protein